MRTALAIVIVTVLGSHALAQAPDPLAVLRDPKQSWTYEVVTGPSIATLEPVTAAPRARCRVTDWNEEGRSRGSIITCRAIGVWSQRSPMPDAVAVVRQTRYLVFDRQAVREHGGPPENAPHHAHAFAFTFPARLADKPWTHDKRNQNLERARIAVRAETMLVRGTRQRVWVSESKHWPPPGGNQRIGRGAAIFAPRVGPVLLCTKVAQPEADYWCLRLLADRSAADLASPTDDDRGPRPPPPPPPPNPVLRVASAKAHVTSSLKPRTVAHRISVVYGAQLERCYKLVLARKPDARGMLNIDITIDAVGRVGKPALRSFDAGLTRCAGKLVGAWRFPIPQSEYAEPRTARFTIVLALTPS